MEVRATSTSPLTLGEALEKWTWVLVGCEMQVAGWDQTATMGVHSLKANDLGIGKACHGGHVGVKAPHQVTAML